MSISPTDQGNLVWQSSNPKESALPGIPRTGDTIGRGRIKIQVPTRCYRIRWHCIPYDYVTSPNSHFDTAIGRINQQTFGRFTPGTALLQGVNLIGDPYTPAFPKFISDTGANEVSQEMLCDLEFTILYKNVTTDCPYTGDTNLSHIYAGHNLAPWGLTGRYYPIANHSPPEADPAIPDEPVYPSFPFQLLFQNPDFSAP